MANTTSTTSIFSAAFTRAIRSIINDHVESDDYHTAVSSLLIAEELEPEYGTAEYIRPLVIAAVSSGSIKGLAIRKGRSGGVYRQEDPAKVAARQTAAAKDELAALQARMAELQALVADDAADATCQAADSLVDSLQSNGKATKQGKAAKAA